MNKIRKLFGEKLMAAVEWASDQQAVIDFPEGDGSTEPLCSQEGVGSNETSLCTASTEGSSQLSLGNGPGSKGCLRC